MKNSGDAAAKHAHLESVLKGIAGFIVVVVALTLTFSAAYLLMAQIYLRLGLNPTPLVGQVINSFVGLFLLVIVGKLMAEIFHSSAWAQQMNMLAPLLKAMEQIARGDFSVRLEQPNRGNISDPINKFFKGVNDMAQEFKQMEAMRQEFISNVSHEIQSPLTSIRGFAQALKNDQISPQERTHYLTIIETESTRLSKLSDNLLALAALEAENMNFEPQPYRLDRQIRHLTLACEPQWMSKGLDLEASLDEVMITADEDLLSQVWINLLHNSIKFTPAGGKIYVDLQQNAGQIAFKIVDTGIGIAGEDQAYVFDRFFKADKARERTQGGSGLGLSIAKKIIEMHKGGIAVESKVGAGAIFSVALPVE